MSSCAIVLAVGGGVTASASTPPSSPAPTPSSTTQPLPSTSAAALVPTTTSTTAAAPTTATPVDPPMPGLVTGVPAIDGYSIAPVPADDVLWRVYDFPPELTLNHGLVVGVDGVPVARLIVASAADGRPAIDIFVESAFANPVFLPVDSTPMPDGGTALTMSGTPPVWTEMEGNAVMTVAQEDGGNNQWAWGAGGLVFIVRGPPGAEFYVRLLQRVHAQSLAPNDYQGMVGDLLDHRPDVAGFRYFDFFRADMFTFEAMRAFPFHCSERFYLGTVTRDGASGESDPSLAIVLEQVGGWCVSNGFLEEAAGSLAGGRRAEQIGGLTVYRDEGVSATLIGDVLVTLYSPNPQWFVDMADFVEQFFAAQPR